MCRGTGLLGLRSQALHKPPSPQGCERKKAEAVRTSLIPVSILGIVIYARDSMRA